MTGAPGDPVGLESALDLQSRVVAIAFFIYFFVFRIKMYLDD